MLPENVCIGDLTVQKQPLLWPHLNRLLYIEIRRLTTPWGWRPSSNCGLSWPNYGSIHFSTGRMNPFIRPYHAGGRRHEEMRLHGGCRDMSNVLDRNRDIEWKRRWLRSLIVSRIPVNLLGARCDPEDEYPRPLPNFKGVPGNRVALLGVLIAPAGFRKRRVATLSRLFKCNPGGSECLYVTNV